MSLILLKLVVYAVVTCGVSTVRAADLFITDSSLWFDQQDRTPVEISIQLKAVSASRFLNRLAASGPVRWKKVSETSFLVFGGFSSPLRVQVDYVGPEIALTVAGKNLFHRDIVRLNQALAELEETGARSRVANLPLAVRVVNLQGQNAFVSAVTGLPVRTIQEIDRRVAEGASSPLIFRYYLDHARRAHEYADLKSVQGDAIVSFLPESTVGRMPLYIPGESVVFHARTYHGASVLGRYNPGLVNKHIAQILTANKFIEAKFWERYAPGALPETHLLANLGLNLSNAGAIQRQLNERFPDGWVMKGTNESNSSLSILTDRTDLANEVYAFLKSDFLAYKKRAAEQTRGLDVDLYYEMLQKHPNYLGWRAYEYTKHPEQTIIQKRAQISKEFRVEVIAGRVLKGATIDRHNYVLERKGIPYEDAPPEIIESVERFTQRVVDRLPPELREMNFAFDTALLKNGGFVVIESNAGSESGFLADTDESIEALNRSMKDYPRQVSSFQLRGYGLEDREQMSYLDRLLKESGIRPLEHLPGYRMTPNEVELQMAPIKTHPRYSLSCKDAFSVTGK